MFSTVDLLSQVFSKQTRSVKCSSAVVIYQTRQTVLQVAGNGMKCWIFSQQWGGRCLFVYVYNIKKSKIIFSTVAFLS